MRLDRRSGHVVDPLSRDLATRGSGHLSWRHRCEPPVPVFDQTGRNAHVLALDLERQHPRLPCADRNAIDGPDGSYLRGSSRKEQLIGNVEHLTRNRSLDDFDIHVARDPNDGVTGDSIEDSGADRRREQLAVANEEEILTAAL